MSSRPSAPPARPTVRLRRFSKPNRSAPAAPCRPIAFCSRPLRLAVEPRRALLAGFSCPQNQRSALRVLQCSAILPAIDGCRTLLSHDSMDAANSSNLASSPAAGQPLLSAGFLGLLATQFLTATNDNIFRWLVIGLGKQ